jgi:hypothetical protein
MHCEFVIPGLFSSRCEDRLPALELLLARARQRDAASHTLEGWLAAAFGLGEEALAAGALTLGAAGGDTGEGSWVRADPVHLRLMRDRLILVPPEALAIAPEEAGAICEALNRHFGGALELRVVDPRRWCARAAQDLGPQNTPALEAAGREVALARDSGPLLTEMQMLLHAHPVNAAREARGEPPINSLWLWGGGQVPKPSSRWDTVLADEPLARGLARLARAGSRPLPSSADAWLEGAPQDGRCLVVLDALRAPAALGETASYDENLKALEAAWFVPLLAALRSGRAGMVTLHVPDGGQPASFEAVRGDLRRIWRRPRALERYA